MEALFETPRLLIREFNPGDAGFIVQLLNTPGWLQFIGDRNVKTTGDAENYLADGPVKSYAQHGFGLYLVVLKSGNVPIGMCGLLKRDTLPHVDLGFAMLPEYNGFGYAQEAAQAILNAARGNLKLKQVAAITSKDNERSIKLLKKLGFVFEEARILQNESEESLVFKIIL